MRGRKKIEEIPGTRYGKLTVIEYAGKGKKGQALWKCKCDCGNETISWGQNLRNGKAKSCGCLRKENFFPKQNNRRLPKGIASFNRALQTMKIHAEKRGYKWELTDEQAKEMMESNCHYCGMPPSNIMKSRYSNGHYRYNGIDRKNNTQNYTFDNTVSCCFECNKAKGTRNYNDFLKWIERLTSNFKG